jgi:ABC-type dipeptide/oligopeptide/nickel transport system permease component
VYFLRRLFLAPLFVLAAVTTVFVVMRVLPGDPAVAMLGNDVTPEVAQAFRQRSGLDQPLGQQYVTLLRHILTLDLGQSLQSNTPVAGRIAQALPFTAQLVVASTAIGLVFGILLGLLAAFQSGRALDSVVGVYVGLIGGTPGYVMSIILLLIFAVGLKLFPVTTQASDPNSPEAVRALVLPAFGLGLAESASIARITRGTAVDLLSHALFVSALRARGVPEWRVRYVHVLRNILVPVLAVVGTQVSTLVAGSVLVETVFNRPGVGILLINGLKQRDFPVVESTLLVFAALVVVIGVLTDLLVGLADPRVSV